MNISREQAHKAEQTQRCAVLPQNMIHNWSLGQPTELD